MKSIFELHEIGGRKCYVLLPKDYNTGNKLYPVVYLNGDKSTCSLLEGADFLSEISYIIVVILPENRLDDSTPWPSPSLHPKFPDFGGKGDEYIKFIEGELKDIVDSNYRTLTSPRSTGICGYSLGGLISIYATFQTDSFGCFASMSGSFWYPDFVQYTADKKICNPKAKIYISSGKTEGVGHKDIKKDAVSCTMKIYDNLSEDLTSDALTISWDEGGHHENAHQRYKNALLWLNRNLEYE